VKWKNKHNEKNKFAEANLFTLTLFHMFKYTPNFISELGAQLPADFWCRTATDVCISRLADTEIGLEVFELFAVVSGCDCVCIYLECC